MLNYRDTMQMTGQEYMLAALLVLAVTTCGNHGARILGLFPFPAKSHMISFTALTQELAHRGHQVTVVSNFPVNPPIPNHTDIVVQDTWPEKASMNMFSFQDSSHFLSLMLGTFWNMGTVTCERALQQPDIQKLIHAEDLHFDIIIYENFVSDCFYGFMHKLNAPVIHISSNTAGLFMGDPVGNPHTASYIPDLFLGYTDRMTFKQRILNFLVGVYYMVGRRIYYLPRQDALIRKYFEAPSFPGIAEMERNTSLLLLNSHITLSFPRPFTPNTVEVGGMHIKMPKELPKDLQQFIDEAPDGVVYFSLGSNVRGADMPEDMCQAFLDAFSKLKQRVLWKWEADTLPGQPANVRLGKWLPQNDILGHPKLRLFITHGGLLSAQEATYHSVPMLAVPIVADQKRNADRAQIAGYALKLELSNISAQSLGWALDELLTNPSYRENVKRLSTLLRDQPQTPLEKAVYWTEYVIRHKGAPHLRSAALDLWWFQYYLLDVLAVLLGGAALITAVTYLSCQAICRRLVGKGKGAQHRKQGRAKKIN